MDIGYIIYKDNILNKTVENDKDVHVLFFTKSIWLLNKIIGFTDVDEFCKLSLMDLETGNILITKYIYEIKNIEYDRTYIRNEYERKTDFELHLLGFSLHDIAKLVFNASRNFYASLPFKLDSTEFDKNYNQIIEIIEYVKSTFNM